MQPSDIYRMCKAGQKPARYFRNRVYIGLTSATKDSWGAWQDRLSAVAWRADSVKEPRLYAVEFDAVLEFSAAVWANITKAIQTEADAQGRQFSRHGDLLTYRESVTHYPVWNRQPA